MTPEASNPAPKLPLPEKEMGKPLERSTGQQQPAPMMMARSEQMIMHFGPLPPAEQLAQYDQVYPGLAKEIVQMAQTQQQHRIELEKTVTAEQLRQGRMGQWLAFGLGIIGVVGAVWAGYIGQPWLGGTILTVCVGTLAVTFLVGKKQEQESRQAKAQRQPEP